MKFNPLSPRIEISWESFQAIFLVTLQKLSALDFYPVAETFHFHFCLWNHGTFPSWICWCSVETFLPSVCLCRVSCVTTPKEYILHLLPAQLAGSKVKSTDWRRFSDVNSWKRLEKNCVWYSLDVRVWRTQQEIVNVKRVHDSGKHFRNIQAATRCRRESPGDVLTRTFTGNITKGADGEKFRENVQSNFLRSHIQT